MLDGEFEKRLMDLFCDNHYLISSDGEVYAEIVRRMIEEVRGLNFDKVVAVEARGWLYGPIIANYFGKPFIPMLKGGKMGNRELVFESSEYVDYSSKNKTLELFNGSISEGDKILLVDDSYITGETARISISLIENFGGKLNGIIVVFNDLNRENERFLEKYNFRFIHKLKQEYKDMAVDVFNSS
tara:strand:- start:2076 stop:2630 length:555 start_codon:yes stop_codon:yes gene_type:complete